MSLAKNCTECGRPTYRRVTRLYGDGRRRCWPGCVRKFEQRLNAKRNADGIFKDNGDPGWNGPSSAAVARELRKEAR